MKVCAHTLNGHVPPSAPRNDEAKRGRRSIDADQCTDSDPVVEILQVPVWKFCLFPRRETTGLTHLAHK